MAQATHNLNRRAVISTLAAVPALAVPAIALADPAADAELLALRPRLEEIISVYLAKQAEDDARTAEYEAVVEVATGVPFRLAHSLEKAPDSYWDIRRDVGRKWFNEHPSRDPDLKEWDALHDRMHPLVDRIFSIEPRTMAGFGVFARAASLNYHDWLSDNDDDGRVGAIVNVLCAVCGVEPVKNA